MRTLNADMSVYSDIELEFFVKELTDALNSVEFLSEPENEYSSFDIDITRSPIFFGYAEAVRKSIDRILNTIYTEQELRSTLKEEMMKKLDAYSLSQLTSIYYTVLTDIEQHRDLLEMLSEEDGTSFRKDTESYIEKQDRYLKLITDVIKKRNAETPKPEDETTPTGTDHTSSGDDVTNTGEEPTTTDDPVNETPTNTGEEPTTTDDPVNDTPTNTGEEPTTNNNDTPSTGGNNATNNHNFPGSAAPSPTPSDDGNKDDDSR